MKNFRDQKSKLKDSGPAKYDHRWTRRRKHADVSRREKLETTSRMFHGTRGVSIRRLYPAADAEDVFYSF